MQTHHIANRQSKDSSKIIFLKIYQTTYCSFTDFKQIYGDIKKYSSSLFLRKYWSNWKEKEKLAVEFDINNLVCYWISLCIYILAFIHVFIRLIVFRNFTFHQDSHLYIISQSIIFKENLTKSMFYIYSCENKFL
jgi:hypothetical protein